MWLNGRRWPRARGSSNGALAERDAGAAPRYADTGMLDVTSDLATTAKPVGIVATMARRVAVALTISIGVALLLLILWKSPKSALFFRTITLGLAATTVFSLFEVWPRRLPRGHERWILQVVAVGAAMPLTLFVMHRRATFPGAPPFFEDHDWMLVGSAALLVAPWTAVATVVRQKEAFARNQKLMFVLERSELERQALDARLHLLQAQVAPHFLFNTLANVQALVDAGSPHASAVLRSLTAYLRAAVPLIAGIFEMPYWRFQIANFSSAFVWAAVLLTLGDGISKGFEFFWR